MHDCTCFLLDIDEKFDFCFDSIQCNKSIKLRKCISLNYGDNYNHPSPLTMTIMTYLNIQKNI